MNHIFFSQYIMVKRPLYIFSQYVVRSLPSSLPRRRTGHEAAQRDFACSLAPIDFRIQLFRSFAIRLTDQQFAALFHLVDTDGNRCDV